MDFVSGLNPQQQQAVKADFGPVLVMAGPGSGKTRVLTQRVAYLIGAMSVSPYNLMAVTFTNKAANEMKERVIRLIGEDTRGLTIGTFHAICARILRRETEHLPFTSNFVIFDSDDQISLIKSSLRELNIDEKRYRPQSVHGSISNAKNELIMPDEYPINSYRDEVVQRVYHYYQGLLLNNNALDFDDLLLWMASLLEENLSVRERYARRYEHILVDEFQDTNLAQYTLLKHLASFHNNIYVVGDTDQSIYRWRGADYRNVLRFDRDFPGTQLILLEQNYRSTQDILDVAMSVINRNPQRTPKRLFTERGQGQKVNLHVVLDDRTEAEYIINTIASLVARGQAQPGDFAVMYRTNAQSRLLEEAFLGAGLPYKLVGAQRFYGRREIKDIISYLRLIHNPVDELSLLRIISTPARGIGDKTLNALRTRAQKIGVEPGNLLIEMGRNPESAHNKAFTKRAAVVLSSFGRLLANWVDMLESHTPLGMMDRIIDDINYQPYIDDGTDEGHSRWENIMELRRLAADFQDRGLEPFLEQIALVSDQDTIEAGAKVPTLLTLHAAKGLEFPIVFIAGLNDGVLPHSRSFEDPEEMMEERRLLYVGITRAKDILYLVFSLKRSAFGYSEPVDPSRFLRDIPEDLLDGVLLKKKRDHQVSTPSHPERWRVPQSEGSTPPKTKDNCYKPGMRVTHSTWGEGMVLNSKLDGSDEIVDVFFKEAGLKKVVASLAGLEIIP
ncbi:MAG: UvrD-helicase domain-containing protein [Chloroflexota bacterium]|nr:UvrD-helicase domain-containing protein [Chloroflexota bacterium]